ncbi:MAG: hypothetical protein OZ934_01975 [Anaerolineae bacterium]|nr:hypothetical protein [Anaerolineae bacterium]
MSLEATILAVLLTGTLGLFVLLPLLEREETPSSGIEGRALPARQRQALETLYAEKGRVLRAIRDLDFDYDMDKLTDTAYAAQRIHLIRLTVAILMRIDELEAEASSQQARVEAAVAATRKARQAKAKRAG